MATISGATSEKVFQIKAWLGLNENPGGDTKLKLGEAAVMRNFAVTRDGNLRRRAGTRNIQTLTAGQTVRGLWAGFVAGHEYLIAACGGKVWTLWDDVSGSFGKVELGSMSTERDIHMFGFSDILYLINGAQYKQWDGAVFKDVDGYRPLVSVAVPTAGGGETLEQVNKLVGTRRCWLSPDGTNATFALPEKGLQSVDYIKNLGTGENLAAADYTFDLTAGAVTFATAPAASVNSYEVGWTMAENFRASVSAMRYGEIYSGTQDTRVFLYGDGTNKAIYSGLDYDGKPRADYFPDLNEVAVGDANTPITGMIRHYSSLICFKSDSTYSIRYGIVTLSDGSLTPAFYTTPTNRAIGNAALGQVRLVLNSPRTLHGNDLYEWKNNSSYSSNLTSDERQAKRVSDRIYSTLGSFDAASCYCWDDNDNQEYYICCNGRALVHNYAVDAWYYYDSFDARCMANLRGELYFGTGAGTVEHLSYDYKNDDGAAIDAYWESGSMSFGSDYMRKYSALVWIGIKPESNAELYVTAQTDKKSEYAEKVVSSSLATFASSNFARWSFAANRKPRMTRLKIKAKKFVFYKLVFSSSSADTTVTVLAADMRVRFTGYTK